MKKKGISPLIATVLILGFTVALAAIIMTWGTGFVKKMQEGTEDTADVQITCATDVLFDIQNACETAVGGTYKLTIANNANKDISSFKIRFYESMDSVKTATYTFNDDGTAGLTAFSIESESDVASGFGVDKVKQIDAIPLINVNNKEVTCAQTIDTFGDVDGGIIGNC